jgi:ABC-type branched-subunit amino acid transport system substrate-binding protein
VRKLRDTKKVVAAGVVVVVLTAACGAAEGTGSGGQPADGQRKAFTMPAGSEVKIMMIATKNTPGLKEQTAFAAAQARVDSINASGGLNGHRLTLLECDENLDPNQERACVGKAVDEKVSAVVGSSLLFDQFDGLQRAGIPLIYNVGLTPKLYQSPISYPTGGVVSWFAGQAMMAKADGVKTIAIGGVNHGSSQAAVDIATKAAENLGLELKGTVTSSITATDLTADAAALSGKGADAILLAASNTYEVPMVRALRQGGFTGKIYVQAPGVKPAELKTLGAAAEGLRVASVGQPTNTADTPLAQQMRSDVADFGSPELLGDERAAASWSGVYLFGHLMAEATSFTAKDVIAALDALKTPIPGGVFGPFAGTGTPPFAAYPRLFSASFLPGTVEKGRIVPSGDFITIPPSVLQ